MAFSPAARGTSGAMPEAKDEQIQQMQAQIEALKAQMVSHGLRPGRAQIALLGCGRWSQGWHIPQLMANPKADLVALCGGRAVDALSKEYGVSGYKDLDALLADDKMVAKLDGIIIATPHAAHYAAGLRCLEKKLNIFMEKPMTTDVQEALELVVGAKKAGKTFMVNNTANWRKSAHLATTMIERGDIGDIRHGMVMFAVPLGFLFNDPKQEGWVKPSGRMQGNGMAWGQAAHTFGWLWMVSGLTPVKVFAFHGKSLNKDSPADVYDSASILCKNGATISVSCVGHIPGKKKHVQNRLFGSEGMLSYCGWYLIDEGDDETPDADPEGDGPLLGGAGDVPHSEGELKLERFDGKNRTVSGFEFENIEKGGDGPESLNAFIDACLGMKHFSGTTAKIGFLCVATIDAMYRSAASGQAEDVVLPEDLK